jgi:hypothetical protein
MAGRGEQYLNNSPNFSIINHYIAKGIDFRKIMKAFIMPDPYGLTQQGFTDKLKSSFYFKKDDAKIISQDMFD